MNADLQSDLTALRRMLEVRNARIETLEAENKRFGDALMSIAYLPHDHADSMVRKMTGIAVDALDGVQQRTDASK